VPHPGYRPVTLIQVADNRLIYSACRCFGLDLGDPTRGGFRYDYSESQVEYSRNLLFALRPSDGPAIHHGLDRAHRLQ
jgi:hypothetical protein